MRDHARKAPLYRKVNTRTRGVHHGGGDDYRHSRHAKRETPIKRGSMGGESRHGLDYTPLFRFLLSRVGDDWNAVHSEAVSRLDREEPIWWLVARSDAEKKALRRVGEGSYWSGLHVGAENRLALVDPDLKPDDLRPSCACCTHTFNGVPFTRPFIAE